MNDKEIIGQTGAVTGVDTPDPKESDPGTIYTSTPEASRVGSADHSSYQAPDVADPKSVTGAFDHLATRDVVAMEHAEQDAEYAGSESQDVVGNSPAIYDALVPNGGLGNVTPSPLVTGPLLGSPDQNPGYTPPSHKAPVHVSERPGDLPEGEAPELERQIGQTDTR